MLLVETIPIRTIQDVIRIGISKTKITLVTTHQYNLCRNDMNDRQFPAVTQLSERCQTDVRDEVKGCNPCIEYLYIKH